MKQSEALEEFKKLFPEDADDLAVSRTHFIGHQFGSNDSFDLWNYSGNIDENLVAASERSFEHALAIAKSGNEDVWPEDHSPIEGEE